MSYGQQSFEISNHIQLHKNLLSSHSKYFNCSARIHSTNFITFYHFLFFTACKQKLDGKTIRGIHGFTFTWFFYMVLGNNQQI